MSGSVNVDMSKLGVFGRIGVEDGHAGNAVAVLKDGKITTSSYWHKANIFRKLARSGTEEELNREIRNAFLTALGSAVGLGEDATHTERLGRLRVLLGEDADVLTGFALGKDGQVSTTKPLTERRISLIVGKLAEQCGLELGPQAGILRTQRMQRFFDEAKTSDDNFVSSILKSCPEVAEKSPLFAKMCNLGIVDRLCMLQLDALVEKGVLKDPSVGELAKCKGKYLIASSASELKMIFENYILARINTALQERASDSWKALNPALSRERAEAILLRLSDGKLDALCREVFSFCARNRIDHVKENERVSPITLDSDQAKELRETIFDKFESEIVKEYENIEGGLKDFKAILDEPEKHVDWLMRELPGLNEFKKSLGKSLADLPDEKLVGLMRKSEDRTWQSCLIACNYEGSLFEKLTDEFRSRHNVVLDHIKKSIEDYIRAKHPEAGPSDGRTLEVIDKVENALDSQLLPSLVDELFDHTFDIHSDAFSKKVAEYIKSQDLGTMVESEFDKLDAKINKLIQECNQQKAAAEQVIAKITRSSKDGVNNDFAVKMIRADIDALDAALKDIPKNAGPGGYKKALELIYGAGYEGIVKASETLLRNGLADDCKMLLGYASAFRKDPDFNKNAEEFKTTREHSALYMLAAKMQPVIRQLNTDVFGAKKSVGADQTQDVGGKAFAIALSHVFRSDKDLKSWFEQKNFENEVQSVLDDYMTDRTQHKKLKKEPSVNIDLHMKDANEGDTLDLDLSKVVSLLEFGVLIHNKLGA